jgi:hypothetical protein
MVQPLRLKLIQFANRSFFPSANYRWGDSPGLFSPWLQIMLWSLVLSACNPMIQPEKSGISSTSQRPQDTAKELTVTTHNSIPPPVPPAAEPERTSHPYSEGIELASSAFVLGQSAQSPDDWELVANRWARAIQTLQTLPQSSPDYPKAQTKITEYQRNLTYAQQRLTA